MHAYFDKMDKNTVTGFILIGVVLIAFTILNRPSPEQIARQKQLRDSIMQVEAEKAKLESKNAEHTLQAADSGSNVADFFNAASAANIQADSLAAQDSTLAQINDLTTPAAPQTEEFVTLENEKIRVKITSKGGRVYSVNLKEHLRHNNDSLYLFQGDEDQFNLDLFNRQSVRLSTQYQYFTPIPSADGKSVTMRLQHGAGQAVDFIYSLTDDDYMVKFDIRVTGMRDGLHPESLSNFRLKWQQKLRQQEKGRKFEERYARLHYKYAGQGVEKLNQAKNQTKEVTEPLKWFAFKDQFFTSVVIADKPFDNSILSSKVLTSEDYLKDYEAEVWAPTTISQSGDELFAGFTYYFGPVHYLTLKQYDKDVKNSADKLDLEELVPLGYKWLSWINKYFVIPVFNLFKSFGWKMGLIIFLLTLLVKLIISPLTYKSYMSSAKMRVLRPQVQEIEAKYPGQENAMQRQKATMELYSRAGASPMSGCMPMLLQMPVFFALFFFFPSAIELRGESFLWAHDLSTYDSIISWTGNIPFITKYLGNHISLFCVLMTVTNVVYTKYNMEASGGGGSQAMPGMKYMPYMMSVMMFFFLNSYPAGLNYYYFVNTLITILLTLMFRKFVDEEKLLARLEANKKKPRKKSGFMARLEEAQKMQEQQARQRAKQNAKKRR